ncbi:hypothetical protein ACFLQZ_04750, partial [Acidobacteriota bacterium]
AISNEYNQIRSYIKTGSSNSHKPSFLIFEDKLVKNILGDIDFPYHLVLTYGYKGIIGSIVIIFGLFYYFVKLNKNAIVIHEWDDTFIYDPIQKKKLFQLYVAPSIPNLIAAVNKSLSDPDVLNKASKFGREKFNLSLQAVKK